MSTKYDINDSDRLTGDNGEVVILSDHAIHRYRQRTPADSEIGLRECWRRGDSIKHPKVAVLDDDRPAEMVRVFRHTDGWSAVLPAVRDYKQYNSNQLVITTVLVVDKYDHPATRAYLEAYGPHDTGDQQ